MKGAYLDQTSLDNLLSETDVTFLKNGLHIKTKKEWIVKGENRYSYTSLIRLAECCREYHWKKDILSNYEYIDSILARCDAKFYKPLKTCKDVEILYTVNDVRNKGYILELNILSIYEINHSKIKLTNIFFDEQKGKAIIPPDSVLSLLRTLSDIK